MKKLLATGLVGACIGINAYGQGTVLFSNYFTGTALDPLVYFGDGLTRVSGPNYRAQLMAGPTPDSMNLVGSPVPFFDGIAAGWFYGGVVTLPDVPAGATAYLTVVVWDTTLGGTTTGASAGDAYNYFRWGGCGHSNIWTASGWDFNGFHPFTSVTGNPYATPPTPPGLLDGMQSFAFNPVPEPPVLAMSGLGLLGFVLWRKPTE